MTDAQQTRSSSNLAKLGTRWGRNTTLLASGSLIGLGLTLVYAIALTHFLSPGEYGQLAILTFFAGFVTMLYNLGSLQGTNLLVFGATGDDDDGGADDDDMDVAIAVDRRRVLTTGLVLTVAIAAGGTLLVFLLREPLTHILGNPAPGDVMIAATSGALGAIWRLTVNVPRLERRPVTYVALNTLRPIGVLAVAVPLVASGEGISGALMGLVGGTAIGLAVNLALSYQAYAPAVEPSLIGEMMRRGSPYIPINLSFFTVHTADLYVLAAFTGHAEVGTYRFGSRLGSFGTYYAAAFVATWSPLTRTATFFAAEQRDRKRLKSVLVLYYWLSALTVMLAIALGADALVDVAPPSYAAAASVVPLIAAGRAIWGLFVVLYRSSDLPYKRKIYIGLSAGAAVLFLVLGLVLAPVMGAQGVALAGVLAFAAGVAVLIWVRQRGGETNIPYGRMAAALASALALFGLGRLGSDTLHAGPWVPKLVAFGAFLALVLLVLVPRPDRRALRAVARGMLPSLGSRRAVRERFANLDPAERRLLQLALDPRQPLDEIYESTGYSESELALRTVWALRDVAALPGPAPEDLRFGRYLISRDAQANRDVMARGMRADGVDLDELDVLESVQSVVRREVRKTRRQSAVLVKAT